MRAALLLILFYAGCHSLAAQDSIVPSAVDTSSTIFPGKIQGAPPDSTLVTERTFDNETLENLRNSNDFDYKQPPSVAESLWDRIMLWLNQFFEWLFRSAVKTNWGQVFMYSVGLVLLIILAMMLLKVDALKVFYSGADHGPLKYQSFEENIHAMDFDQLIRDALQKKEYRNAVRLTFLHSLKLLSDKQHLDWRPGKTNHEYLDELARPDLKTGFNELSFYFDYAWYGDFSVNENLYQRVHTIFDEWRKKVE